MISDKFHSQFERKSLTLSPTMLNSISESWIQRDESFISQLLPSKQPKFVTGGVDFSTLDICS